MTRVALPTPSDISGSSLRWACELLGEMPTELRIHPFDRAHALQAVSATADLDVPVITDGSLGTVCVWLLKGNTREVYSEGA